MKSSSLPETGDRLKQSLSVWDAASLLIGIVVGTAIFKTPQQVFGNVPDVQTGMLLWAVGAFLALNGALCYCELATTYPRHGAEYVYLSKAYGQRIGFLFAWMQMCVILTASIGAMAFVFADYSAAIIEGLSAHKAIVASGAIVVLGFVHLCGVHVGKTSQNVLTVSKLLALFVILGIGFFATAEPMQSTPSSSADPPNIGLALVFVLYAYGGWNDAAMVTPEVHNYQRNMPRALIIGLFAIALLYLGLNATFYKVLGFEGLRTSAIPAADVVSLSMGKYASDLMSLIVMCSALGAVHGMLFASSRLLSAIGSDYKIFAKWNVWNSRQVPVAAILTVTGITLVLIQTVGTVRGKKTTEKLADLLWLPIPNWEKFSGGFETLVAATAPIFWFFFALSGFAVIVLRVREAQVERPFRVPFYPLPPLIFCGSALFMLWKSLLHAGNLTLLSLPVFLIGILLSFSKRTDQKSSN